MRTLLTIAFVLLFAGPIATFVAATVGMVYMFAH